VNLPPDPGAEGKKTLLGIDTDGDGVRDDIQRYIYLTYPDDKKLRLGLTYYAIEFQGVSKMQTTVRLLTIMQTRWPAMVNVFGTLRVEILFTLLMHFSLRY
jgi:hypothetical protein